MRELWSGLVRRHERSDCGEGERCIVWCPIEVGVTAAANWATD